MRNYTEIHKGQQFGRLEILDTTPVLKETRSGNWQKVIVCRCECGTIVYARRNNIVRGYTKSCGCIARESSGERGREMCLTLLRETNTKHGDAKLALEGDNGGRLYNVWKDMIKRCFNPNHSSYKYYGERGITVCQEWRDSYTAFKSWALDNGYRFDAPRFECTIDRIDVNGNYEPSNCRWVPMSVQSKNKRNSKAV